MCVPGLHPDWSFTHVKNYQQKVDGSCPIVQKSFNMLQGFNESPHKDSEIYEYEYVDNPSLYEKQILFVWQRGNTI